MADGTKIEWTDASWNPVRAKAVIPTNDGGGKFVTGWHCEHVSDGCRNCYAEAINRRLGTTFDFKPGHLKHRTPRGDARGDVSLFLDEKMLALPLRWKRPRMVFVCSMTDLFADFVSDAWIDQVFAVMALAPQHTFQVLTKRARRMREYMTERWQPALAQRMRLGNDVIDMPAETQGEDREDQVRAACEPFLERLGLVDTDRDDLWTEDGNPKALQWKWPLQNVWLGVSAEDQLRADERIPELLQTPAAVRFISAEPLLGAIDLMRIRPAEESRLFGFPNVDALLGAHYVDGHQPPHPDDHPGQVRLDWIIVGGESGPNARPMHPDWARQLRDQCAAAGVAFFFKQWGAWGPIGQTEAADEAGWEGRGEWKVMSPAARIRNGDHMWPDDSLGEAAMVRVGKKAAGRQLDGIEHSAFPHGEPVEPPEVKR